MTFICKLQLRLLKCSHMFVPRLKVSQYPSKTCTLQLCVDFLIVRYTRQYNILPADVSACDIQLSYRPRSHTVCVTFCSRLMIICLVLYAQISRTSNYVSIRKVLDPFLSVCVHYTDDTCDLKVMLVPKFGQCLLFTQERQLAIFAK